MEALDAALAYKPVNRLNKTTAQFILSFTALLGIIVLIYTKAIEGGTATMFLSVITGHFLGSTVTGNKPNE